VPSRDNKPRGGVAVSPAADRETSQAGAEATAPPPQAARATTQQAAKSPATSRRALKNWRVRSRLLLLITIPTLTAVILGGTRIVTSVQGALTFQRIEQLANLSSGITTLAGKMEDERDQTVIYIADGQTGRAAALAGNKKAAAAQMQLLQQQYNTFTRPWVNTVNSELANIGSTYPQVVQQDVSAVKSVLAGLPDLRAAANSTDLPVLPVVAKYTAAIDSLLRIDNDIALDSGDPVLASNVRALGVISRIEEETSEQRAYLAYAFTQESLAQGVLSALTTSQAEMNDNISEFNASGTAQQTSLYANTVAGSLVDFADQYEQQAIASGQSGPSLATLATTPEEWFGAMSGKIGAMRKVEQKLVAASVDRASSLRRTAIIDSIGIGAAIVLVLGLALILTTLVGRSMVRPLRRLRAGALEVAGLQLPETVRRMSESDGSGAPITVEPIDVDSTDEIGEVARAFDQVHREALRLAANEAALRGNVNAMFVNLSRRSQSLVERQIRLIDDLEQGEQDAERLGSLFQMDHLATRMRRNSENLLVLAGHDSSRRWNQPVALVDVLRAAVSEIEQYERVSLNVQPGISVRGHAVNDAVHLLAELAENATSFSSAETPVTISGHLLSSGGVLLDITDQGVGMGAEEMAHANWRLDNPPVVDVAVSRRMGLFVVARLAARHGVRVRLRPAGSGGLTALVWLPDEVVSRDSSPAGSRMPEVPGETVNGSSMPGLPDRNGNYATDERSATAHEVDAARTPKFASLQSGAGENGTTLGPRRVPGSGPRPGGDQWSPPAAGPLSAFPTSPQPAGEAGSESWGTAPQRAVSADGWDNGVGQGSREPETSGFPSGDYANSDFASNDFSGNDFSGGDYPTGDYPTGDFPTANFPRTGLESTGPAGAEQVGSGFPGTGPLPAAGRESFGSWPEPPDAQSAPAESADAQSSAAESPAAQASRTQPSGNGLKLPKRQVDRAESRDANPGPVGSRDLFSSGGDRTPGRSLFETSPAPGAKLPDPADSAQPADSAERPDPGEPVGAGAGSSGVFNAPVTHDLGARTPTNGSNGTTNGSHGSGSNGSNGFSWDSGSSADEVVVPPAEPATEYRLPIFEAVESDWFRRGRSSVGWSPPESAAEAEKSNWTSPSDEGWQAAAAVAAAPSSSGVTPAGLPKRVPKANLVPGTAGAESSSAPAPAPARSASATRDRFSSFQRGTKEGRAAATGDDPTGEDDGSR
jgi:signal transduction histidine kinase